MQDEWMTVAEIAEWLKVKEQTVRRWCRRGDLPAVLLSDKAGYRVRREDLEAFLRQRAEGQPDTGKAAA